MHFFAKNEAHDNHNLMMKRTCAKVDTKAVGKTTPELQRQKLDESANEKDNICS